MLYMFLSGLSSCLMSAIQYYMLWNLITLTNKNPLLCILREKISTQTNMHFGVYIEIFCRN